MGKYSEAIKAKLATLGKAKVGSVADFVKDPEGQIKQIYLENDEFFIRQEISKKMEESLRALPEQKRNEINALNVPEEEKWTAIADAYEAQFGNEAAELAAKEVEGFVSPSDPRFPKEKLVENPMKDEIDALRGEIKPDDPKAAEKRALLDKVDQDLVVTQIEPLMHIDRLDNTLIHCMNAVNFTNVKQYIDGYQDGKYASKLPTEACEHIDMRRYLPDSVFPSNCTFSSKDSKELVGTLPNAIPSGLKEDVIDITNKMEQHSEGYELGGKTIFADKSPSGRPYYLSEQGTKAYAFWPLQDAYEKLSEAIKTKDFDKIREAEKKYSEERKFTDEMMAIMGKYKTPLSGANVNSTRYSPRLALPTEYIKDFVSHSKLNGIYMLHAFSKNNGISVKDILDDPVTAMRNSAAKFIAQEGLNIKTTLGAKLAACMSSTYGPAINQAYQYNDPSLLAGAYEAMAAMESDPEKRKQIAGTGALAEAAGVALVGEYTNKIDKLSRLDKERADYLYQHAVLMPDEEFDPIALYDKLDKENWKTAMDPKKLVAKLRKAGKLDYNALAGKIVRVVNEVNEERQDDSGTDITSFSYDQFFRSGMEAYKEVLRTATPEEMKTPAFRKFREGMFDACLKYGLTGTDKSVADATRAMNDFNDGVALQMREKSGWFLSSKNTDEHDRMTIAQRKLQYKLKQITGEEITDLPPDEMEALKNTDLKKLMDKARSETYKYCCLKTNNGKDSGFLHKAGADRYNSAYNSLEAIDNMAEACGLLSPGEKLLNATRRQLMNSRNDKEWARSMAEEAAARAILGMTLANGKKSFEEQNKYLDQAKLDASVNKIKQDPAFRRMMQNEGVDKMIDNIIIGNSSVTDAYIKAQAQVRRETTQANLDRHLQGAIVHGNDDVPPAMTNEEKKEMWGNNPIEL